MCVSFVVQGADYITVQLQQAQNRDYAVVLNTYQLYLKGSDRILMSDVARARCHGYVFGGKLVRGAYIKEEREMAEKEGHPSPVHDNKKQTDNNYNS